MPWYDDEIAGPMGYKYCVLFDCARDAIRAWPHGIVLPENICPSVRAARSDAELAEIDQNTGLSAFAPVHLYGYQSPANGYKLALDPLMTGWVRELSSESAIISFGRKKMLSIGYGGAFLTDNLSLRDKMAERGHWNEAYTDYLRDNLKVFHLDIQERWDTVAWWDRYLGDSLIRIPGEQLMPWRVMRRAVDIWQRADIVSALRNAGYDVGTNYPPLTGSNLWGDTVLNFFCSPDIEKVDVQNACEIVKRVRPWLKS